MAAWEKSLSPVEVVTRRRTPGDTSNADRSVLAAPQQMVMYIYYDQFCTDVQFRTTKKNEMSVYKPTNTIKHYWPSTDTLLTVTLQHQSKTVGARGSICNCYVWFLPAFLSMKSLRGPWRGLKTSSHWLH
jgi:hypothetical protein